MRALDLAAFDAESARYDALVVADPHLDRFCSSSDWVLPAALDLVPGREPFLYRGAHGYVALVRTRHGAGVACLEPLEATWGLACPLVGPEPAALAADLAALCASRAPRDVLLLTGVARDSPLFAGLVAALAPRHHLRLGPGTRRFVARLDGGVDGFLSRRSPNLRQTLAQARRRAGAAGVTFVGCRPRGADEADAVYTRILDVERRSWKGRSGTGLADGAMRGFYARMVRRLAARGSLRVDFARHGDRDVAYVVAAVLGDTCRALQASYDAAWARCSLGGLIHLHRIAGCCAEGLSAYDLGTDVDYKRRWAEPGLETVALIAIPR